MNIRKIAISKWHRHFEAAGTRAELQKLRKAAYTIPIFLHPTPKSGYQFVPLIDFQCPPAVIILLKKHDFLNARVLT
jgi:hypothetical protein